MSDTSDRYTNFERRMRRLPATEDEMMRAVAMSLLVEIRTLHRIIESMALAIPRELMDDRERSMLDDILGNEP